MILYVLLFLGGALLSWNYFRARDNSRLPPKIPGAIPILGHLLALGDFPCKILLNWKKKYGPVYIVKFGSFRTVVFNDTKSVKEAFKLVAFNDRP
ncbi:unnamed protein product, partial [Allacma fusca]